jgi:DNA-binding FadR family transcriptional regulator
MVAAQLRRQVVTGELKEGDMLPSEAILMERFGVSRPTLREAFRILESEQIISVRRGAHGGARVLVPDGRVAGEYAGLLLQYQGATIADVYEARTVLEVSVVGLLTKRRTAAELKRLEQALADGEEVTADPAAYGRHDTDFHLLLVDLAGNETLGVLVAMLYHIIDSHNRSYLRMHAPEVARPAAKVAQRAHVKLLELLRDKDADRAQDFWRRHLDQVTAYMVQDRAETLVDILS